MKRGHRVVAFAPGPGSLCVPTRRVRVRNLMTAFPLCLWLPESAGLCSHTGPLGSELNVVLWNRTFQMGCSCFMWKILKLGCAFTLAVGFTLSFTRCLQVGEAKPAALFSMCW